MSRANLRARPIIMAISDRRRFGADDRGACDQLVTWAAMVARARVDLIQVRERGLDDQRLSTLVRRVCSATAGTAARVVVNERIDIAIAAGASGVHLTAVAPEASRVRAIVRDEFVIGRSVHSDDEAVNAERDGGCDYLVFGTVFPSPSKPVDHPVAGASALAAICARVALPVVAIGGIDEHRAADVARAGAAGIAAIGLFAPTMTPMVEGDRQSDTESHLARIVQALRHAFEVEPRPAAPATSR